mmetsp:Transcript_20176/g.46560  ORF Transcript_20176/g.46560 Transcript_20176/m.46560 type:complete len:248 (-) Transcript_20176:317-1060(-)
MRALSRRTSRALAARESARCAASPRALQRPRPPCPGMPRSRGAQSLRHHFGRLNPSPPLRPARRADLAYRGWRCQQRRLGRTAANSDKRTSRSRWLVAPGMPLCVRGWLRERPSLRAEAPCRAAGAARRGRYWHRLSTGRRRQEGCASAYAKEANVTAEQPRRPTLARYRRPSPRVNRLASPLAKLWLRYLLGALCVPAWRGRGSSGYCQLRRLRLTTAWAWRKRTGAVPSIRGVLRCSMAAAGALL